jgi:hypothetical protein
MNLKLKLDKETKSFIRYANPDRNQPAHVYLTPEQAAEFGNPETLNVEVQPCP